MLPSAFLVTLFWECTCANLLLNKIPDWLRSMEIVSVSKLYFTTVFCPSPTRTLNPTSLVPAFGLKFATIS